MDNKVLGSQLDLDDVAATSDLAMQELLEMRAEANSLRSELEALKAKLATAGADALDKAADEYAAEAGELLLEKSGWKPVTGTWLRSLADKLREKAALLREGGA